MDSFVEVLAVIPANRKRKEPTTPGTEASDKDSSATDVENSSQPTQKVLKLDGEDDATDAALALEKKMEDIQKREEQLKLREEKLLIATNNKTPKAKTPAGEKRKKSDEEKEREEIRKELIRKEREEIRKEKEEKRRQNEEERIKNKKQKELEKQQKEEKRKELENERRRVKEQKEQEKEAKLRQKEAEKQEKQRKLDEKAEQKRLKEEEKQQQEQEKKRIEEERKQREMKQQAMLLKFVIKKDSKATQRPSIGQDTRFAPFELKEGMQVAPIRRRDSLADSCLKTLDNLLVSQDSGREDLYVCALKSHRVNPGRSGRTLVCADVEVVDKESECSKLKAKLCQFHENYRPPYYGTWRKWSAKISARRPFAKDSVIDYEFDSDEEWEDEPEGDECRSDDDEDEEKEDEDEEGDGWLVAHGYLSEGEGDEDDDDQLDPETRRARMLAKDEAWKAENVNKKWHKLQPLLIGPAWTSAPVEEQLMNKLELYKAVVCCEGSVPNAFVV